MRRRPEPDEYAPYFQRYLDNVPEDDILAALKAQSESTTSRLRTVDEERSAYRYAPGKWTLKQVLGHVIDTEKIIGYRGLAASQVAPTTVPRTRNVLRNEITVLSSALVPTAIRSAARSSGAVRHRSHSTGRH